MLDKLSTEKPKKASLWRFGEAEFDELRRELKLRGQAVELEAKPLDVLLHLLQHAGEVVSKEELLDAVWPGVVVVEGSLPTAVSKLRRALGDKAQSFIATVPRVGYRLDGPVQRREISSPGLAGLALRAGQAVPGRDAWRLTERLDISLHSEVWRCGHHKTREQRVFKFAGDGMQLRALKREATVARLLREALGERSEFVRLLEWNFETAPYFLESEYVGPSLTAWAIQQGGLGAVPLEARLKLCLSIVEAVALAHSVGVLHGDLKPGNVLIAPDGNGSWQVKLSDFGSAQLLGTHAEDLAITRLGFTRNVAEDRDPLTGTPLYLAPEVIAGQMPSQAADVYSLGVMLYQLCVGDFRRPVTAGWEQDIDDSVLREDIAAAAAGDPTRRLRTPVELAHRLSRLPARRANHQALADAEQRALMAERALEHSRARRPWIAAAGVALLGGTVASTFYYLQAKQAETQAVSEAATAKAINDFLNRDLIATADPRFSDNNQIGLVNAVRKAATRIDERFSQQPQIAARLHQTVADALATIGEAADAELEYAQACNGLRNQATASYADCQSARTRNLAKLGRYEDATKLVAELRDLPSEALPAKVQLRILLADADLDWQKDDNTQAAIKAKQLLERYQVLTAKQPATDAWQDLGIEIRRVAAGILHYGRDLEGARTIIVPLVRDATLRYGPHNGLTIDIRNREVINLIGLRRLDEALPLARAAVTDAKAAFGDRATVTLNSLGNLAYLYNVQTEVAKENGSVSNLIQQNQLEAVRILEETSRACIDKFGEPFCAGTIQDLALSHLRAGQYPAAEKQYWRVYQIAVSAAGADSPRSSRAAFLAAEMFLSESQAKTGKAFLDKAKLDSLREAMPDYALDCRWPLAWGRYHLLMHHDQLAAEALRSAIAAAPSESDTENGYLRKEAQSLINTLPASFQSALSGKPTI